MTLQSCRTRRVYHRASITQHPQLRPHTIKQPHEICPRDQLLLLVTQFCQIMNTEFLAQYPSDDSCTIQAPKLRDCFLDPGVHLRGFADVDGGD